jgi:hypothetical protein
MPGNQKRKNPGTPSPRKRATRKTKQTHTESSIVLPGGALQTSFRVEGLYTYTLNQLLSCIALY